MKIANDGPASSPPTRFSFDDTVVGRALDELLDDDRDELEREREDDDELVEREEARGDEWDEELAREEECDEVDE